MTRDYRVSAAVALMALIGWLNGLGWDITGLCWWRARCLCQQKLITNREREACFKAFMNNNYGGTVLF